MCPDNLNSPPTFEQLPPPQPVSVPTPPQDSATVWTVNSTDKEETEYRHK